MENKSNIITENVPTMVYTGKRKTRSDVLSAISNMKAAKKTCFIKKRVDFQAMIAARETLSIQ